MPPKPERRLIVLSEPLVLGTTHFEFDADTALAQKLEPRQDVSAGRRFVHRLPTG